jgi:hypothetical protein
MNNPSYRAVHAIPAFMVGGLVWCVLAALLSRLDYGVLGYFSVPGYSTWFILFSAAAVFFPVFFVLRWINRLNMATFPGGLTLATLALVMIGEPASATLTALLTVMAFISGTVAFWCSGVARVQIRAARSNNSFKPKPLRGSA